MSDDRPLRYVDPDGTIVYRASGLGACDGVVLGLAAGRKPNAVPEWLQEVYDEGTRMESAIINELLTLDPYSSLQLDTQTEWELEVGEVNDRRVIVRGHSDGWDPKQGTIVEAKKFRPSTWPKFQRSGVECNPFYPWQVSTYWHAAQQAGYEGITALFVGGRFIPAKVDEFDGRVITPEYVEEVGVFPITNPPIPLKAIRKRIARWENMIADGLDVTDLSEPCSTRMFPCAMFGKGCPSEALAEQPLELTGEFVVVGRALAEKLATQAVISKTAQTMLDEAKKVKKELEEGVRALQAALVEAGVVDTAPSKMTVDGYTITHVTGSVPEKVTKGYDLDYMKVTAPKGTS